MTTRFPQSGASVNYRIKAEYASKIKAIFWAAGADAAHRLYPGDTATTVITRATSGCTFDTENGVIAGQNYDGTSGIYFSDAKSGGYGVSENTAFGLGACAWGDIAYGLNKGALVSTHATVPTDPYFNKSRILFGEGGYDFGNGISGQSSTSFHDGGLSDDVRGWISTAFRYDPSDPVNKFRHWLNGSERTASRSDPTPTSSVSIGDTGTPLRFGGTSTGGRNAAAWFECCYVHTGLTDAELNAITADPSIIIETSSGGSTDATANGATLTGTATLSAGSATGSGDGAASGATLTGSSSLIAGTAIGGASGTFVSSPMYSSGILKVSVAADWTWYPGVIGADPTSALVHGSGVTSVAGTLALSGLPTGDGFMLAETEDGAIYYEAGTVS